MRVCFDFLFGFFIKTDETAIILTVRRNFSITRHSVDRIGLVSLH